MDAIEFLKSLGIEIKATTLIVNIDGVNRQPDLIKLMEGYHLAKKKHENIKST